MSEDDAPPSTQQHSSWSSAPGVRSLRFGRFWYHAQEDHWQWSDELARLYGYESADALEPTSQVLLQHKHPDDVELVAELIEHVRHAGEPFSSRYRIVDLLGAIVPVIVVTDAMLEPGTGRRWGTFGFYVVADSAEAIAAAEVEQTGDEARFVRSEVDEIIRRRATIERVKGALMLAYRLESQQAFDLLVWCSQESNSKLHTLAASIEARLGEVDVPSISRSRFDLILSTAHEDVPMTGQC